MIFLLRIFPIFPFGILGNILYEIQRFPFENYLLIRFIISFKFNQRQSAAIGYLIEWRKIKTKSHKSGELNETWRIQYTACTYRNYSIP